MAQYTKQQLAKKSKPDLIELAEELDLELEGTETKAELIEAILASQTDEDEVETDDEELDDEVDEDELDDVEPELPEDDEEDDIDDDEPAPKPTKAKSKTKRAEPSGDTLAAKQVAQLVGTEAKTLRQFFRSDASTVKPVGSGGRYEFDKADVPQIKEEFEAWKSAHAARGTKRGKVKSDVAAEVVEEVEGIDELEDEPEEELEIDDEDLELEDEDEDED